LPSIYYQARQYQNSHSHINSAGIESIQCRKIDLYRAMITVGNPSFISKDRIREFGLVRTIYSSIVEKIGLVGENIQSDANGMRLHPIYHTHVSDKKRIVSYNLGMAFAKLYAEKLLNIPSLIHVESLKAYGALDFVDPEDGRGREPDLVGQCSNGDWHVFEAKGMSRNQLNTKITDAKEQVERVSMVEGRTPATLNACATYLSDERILTYLEDPESKSEKVIRVLREKFVDSSYKPVFMISDAIDRKLELRRDDGLSYYAVDFEAKGVDLTIGLDEEVHDLVMQGEFSAITTSSREKFQQESLSAYDNECSIGLDGIIVKHRNQ